MSEIKGYTAQIPERIAQVNRNKEIEERALRVLDELEQSGADAQWLAIGRTQIQQGWMAVNRAIMQPERVVLAPEPQAPPVVPPFAPTIS